VISALFASTGNRIRICSVVLAALMVVACNKVDPVEFEVATKEGVFFSKQHREEVIYLDFWATWCGPCRDSFPWMKDMQEKYADRGLKVVAVSLDTDHDLALRFANELESNFLIGFDDDGTLADSFQVLGMPTSVIVGRGGKVVEVHQGFNLSDMDDYENSIRKALDAG